MQAQMNFKVCKLVELLHAFHPLGNSSTLYFMLALVFLVSMCSNAHCIFKQKMAQMQAQLNFNLRHQR